MCNAPVPAEVPAPLQGLSEEAALLVLYDVGPEIRAANNTGYRQHATIMRFFWHETSTKNIKLIEDESEGQGQVQEHLTSLLA